MSILDVPVFHSPQYPVPCWRCCGPIGPYVPCWLCAGCEAEIADIGAWYDLERFLAEEE